MTIFAVTVGFFAWGALVAAVFLRSVRRSAEARSSKGTLPRIVVAALALAAPGLSRPEALIATLAGFILWRLVRLPSMEVGRGGH